MCLSFAISRYELPTLDQIGSINVKYHFFFRLGQFIFKSMNKNVCAHHAKWYGIKILYIISVLYSSSILFSPLLFLFHSELFILKTNDWAPPQRIEWFTFDYFIAMPMMIDVQITLHIDWFVVRMCANRPGIELNCLNWSIDKSAAHDTANVHNKIIQSMPIWIPL